VNRPALLAVFVAVALTASACGGSGSPKSGTTTPVRRQLTDLHGINQLRTAFNTASDRPRLIVLVSPT